MSGHSKWSQIKHGKAIADKKKGTLFSKLVNAIIIAAREGIDPDLNFKLRIAIDRAKAASMPKDTIDRAIEKIATEKEKIEEFLFEGFGPSGVALLIKVITINKSQATVAIKSIFKKHNSHLAEEGSVKWMFDQFVVFVCQEKDNLEDLELKLIEAGAEEINVKEGEVFVYSRLENSKKVKEILEKEGAEIKSIDLDWIEKNPFILEKPEEKEKVKNFINELLETEEVEEVYSNMKL